MSKRAVELFNKYAKEYEGKFMNVDRYGDTFDVFCKRIKKENARVLELACGPGNITRYLLSKRPDFKIKGTDLADNMIELTKINNPSAKFEKMDCRDTGKLEEKYDGIMCGFCLPYLCKEETEQLISDAYARLNDEGVIYISTMEDDYGKSGLEKGSQGDEIFMHYYEGDYLKEVLEGVGFRDIALERKEYMAGNEKWTKDIVIIATKFD